MRRLTKVLVSNSTFLVDDKCTSSSVSVYTSSCIVLFYEVCATESFDAHTVLFQVFQIIGIMLVTQYFIVLSFILKGLR